MQRTSIYRVGRSTRCNYCVSFDGRDAIHARHAWVAKSGVDPKGNPATGWKQHIFPMFRIRFICPCTLHPAVDLWINHEMPLPCPTEAA